MDATEIFEGIWQGGELWPAMPTGYKKVMGLRWEAMDYVPLLGIVQGLATFVWNPLQDLPVLPDRDTLHDAVGMVLGWHAMGWRCLIHCAEGHNRSGLIVGLTLRELGMSGADAVALIQAKRPGALGNQVFREAVLTGI